MAKQNATARPGRPMPRNNLTVPCQPSRQTMKQIRKAAAQTERQNTTVQLSPASMKRAMAPPKLHISADRNINRKPIRSSRGETAGETAIGDDAVSVMGTAVDDFGAARCATDDKNVPHWRNAKTIARRDPADGDGYGKDGRSPATASLEIEGA